ncbi:MAG: damage-inducible protein DinB [Acidobacteria bacterium]|nr:damage-inducible protein DinB [Acidobacteriota bacterium]
MQLLETARDLLAHAAWADAEVWIAVRAFPDAWSDTTLREKLHHIHIVQYAFPAIWDHGPIDVAPLESFADAEAMFAWARAGHDALAARATSVTESEAATPASVPWSKLLAERIGRDPAPVTVFETMLQVASHSTYHRGQVNTRLRELGGKPPLADYIAWIWLGRPAARWELLDG